MTEQPSRDDFTDIPATDDLAHPKPRHDGWSPDKQVVFLEALARTGNVRAAARYAGLSRESAYKLRRRPDARAFARAWDAAIIHARDIFQDELMDKGLNGWREAVWHQGEEVGTRERWSAPLFLAALARLDRMADGLDLTDKPAQAAAERFDDLLDGISKGDDCAELVEEIDSTGQVAGEQPQCYLSNGEMMKVLEGKTGHAPIWATAPEHIDMSDMDVAEYESWDDLDWERAECSELPDHSETPDPIESEQKQVRIM